MKQHKATLYRISLLILIILTTVAVHDCPSPITNQYLVTKVIDGDTIQLEDKRTVRYIGADTPETVEPGTPIECFGPQATAFNKELVEGRYVYLHYDVDRLDNRGRTLAYVNLAGRSERDHDVDGTFVNAELIRHGYARFVEYPPNTEYSEYFSELQCKAKNAQRGLWGECDPRDDDPECDEPPPDCLYVASANSDVFHHDSCHHVDNILDSNKRCFSTRQAAVNSGRRPCKTCNP